MVQRLAALFPRPAKPAPGKAKSKGRAVKGSHGTPSSDTAEAGDHSTSDGAAAGCPVPGAAARDPAPEGNHSYTRVLYSFQGAIVAPVVEAFADCIDKAQAAGLLPADVVRELSIPDAAADAREGTGAADGGSVEAPASGGAGGAVPDSSAAADADADAGAATAASTGEAPSSFRRSPKPPAPAAGKQTMSVLTSLAEDELVFETDAPYQPFSADLDWCPAYRRCWRDAVVAEMLVLAQQQGVPLDAASADAALASVGSATSLAPLPSATGAASAAAIVRSSGSGSGSEKPHPGLECCAAAESCSAAPENHPSRVLDVVIAAATWRQLKRPAHGGKSASAGGRVAAPHTGEPGLDSSVDATRPATVGGVDSRLREALSRLGWPSVRDTASAAVGLLASSAANIRAVFARREG